MKVNRRAGWFCPVMAVVWSISALGGEVSVEEWGREQRLEFLATAEIVGTTSIAVGVTGSLRATLRDGSRSHDVHIQTVDQMAKGHDTGKKVYYILRDNYRYNVAAFRLDALLGLGMVPESVRRRFRGKEAAFTWWVDDVLMSEAERVEAQLVAPDYPLWFHRIEQLRVFNQLVHNTDFNTGNLLIDESWKLWLIDLTRAFVEEPHLSPEAKPLPQRIDRRFFEALGDLEPEAVRIEMKGALTRREIKALLARRELVLEHFRSLAAELGDEEVIVDSPDMSVGAGQVGPIAIDARRAP